MDNIKPKIVLITGITGSGGSYLAEFIASNHPDVDIHGISRWHSTSASNNLEIVKHKVLVHECDLNDLSAVYRVIKKVHPDAIFHLASHANVRASFDTPIGVLKNNIIGTANLFEAVRMLEIDPIIQVCSTSEVYGHVNPDEVPISEDAPMRPQSPYAVSKATQDLLGRMYFVSYGMRVVRTRMFAYFNPKRSDLFATSFARQVAWAERGLQNEVIHGNLDSIRTLVDVRDAMRAYWDAIMFCDPGEAYNIGGATTITVGEVLDKLISLSGVEIVTRLDSNLLRPSDVTLQVPDITKFQRKTGWKPIYSFEESLNYLYEYWQAKAEKVDRRMRRDV
jgi:GDP-mannose 4,6-dehydratase